MKLTGSFFNIALQCFERSQLRCVHQSPVLLFSPSTKISRPPSSFGLFLQERKDEIMNDSSVFGNNFMKHAAKEWKNLSFVDKQEYADRAQKAMTEYKSSMNSLTDFEKDQMKGVKIQQKADRLTRKNKKMKVSLGQPKKVLSAYNIFMKKMYSTHEVRLQDYRSIAEAARAVKMRWDNLPFEDKEEFDVQAQEDKERYLTEMERYVRRLRKEGLEELVPKKFKTMWL